jgi:hypothetical protein
MMSSHTPVILGSETLQNPGLTALPTGRDRNPVPEPVSRDVRRA